MSGTKKLSKASKQYKAEYQRQYRKGNPEKYKAHWTGLGHFHDNPAFLRAGAEYLERHASG